MDAVEAVHRQHVVDHLDRIVLQDADVFQALFGDAFEQRTDARRVDFTAEKIRLRHLRGDMRGGLAHAEADLKHRRCVALKNG